MEGQKARARNMSIEPYAGKAVELARRRTGGLKLNNLHVRRNPHFQQEYYWGSSMVRSQWVQGRRYGLTSRADVPRSELGEIR